MNVLKQISRISLAITALFAIVFTILDLFNLYSVDFNFNKVVLLLLSLLSIYFVSQHFLNEKIQDDIVVNIDSIKKIPDNNIIFFNDSVQIEAALGAAVLRAKKSVCDLSWKNVISSGFDTKNRKKSHSNLEGNISNAASNILYREIFILNDYRRVEKLKRRLTENADGYSCKYFKRDNIIPRLQFVIVDDEQIFFFASSANSPLCLIKDSRVCNIFLTYYEELWSKATFIKDGSRIYQNEIDKIDKSIKMHANNVYKK